MVFTRKCIRTSIILEIVSSFAPSRISILNPLNVAANMADVGRLRSRYVWHSSPPFPTSWSWNMVSEFRDADDAVYGRDGYDYDGYRLRVEFPRSGRGSRGGFGGIGGAPRGRYGPPSRRSEYRVLVSGKHHFLPRCTLFDIPKRCVYFSLTAFFFFFWINNKSFLEGNGKRWSATCSVWCDYLWFRTPSERQLARSEGPHAWSRRCLLRRRLQGWDWSCRVCAQRRHDLCCSKAGQHQIPLAWGMCSDLIVRDIVFFAWL